MTPELKSACEVVFQEHKASGDPIRWNRDAFQGRISFGLSALAKETLVKKNIIYVADPSKKVMTMLNPAAVSASNFEEAEELVQQKALAPVINIRQGAYQAITTGRAYHVRGNQAAFFAPNHFKWYQKSLFWYFIWPLSAAIAGALIASFMSWAYVQLFF